MYVCICNGITDHQIREAAAAGCTTVAELTMRTGAGANCGSCLDMAMDVLQSAQPAPGKPLLPILTLSHAA
ncbi:bacterioferritin-associated ferredoxin [Pseudoxanthomonas sp.]|uniref:(2Fe-2S)-binding protein n=1 Tax=Pseudoxanthomonas sp. TaxID=1871049 RepID=UPI002FE088D8